jgi:DNA-binding transcriptional regulator PaaX
VQWLVLIYTIPPEPTRKRAFVWRELKKIGAVYLRDGVCALPDQPATRLAVQAIVNRVRAFDGRATLVEAALIDDLSAQEVVRQSRAARQAEYDALTTSSRELLEHVRRELAHRDFAEVETRSLLEDVGKLWRWYDQICARDYFAADTAATASAPIAECESTIRDMRAGVATG